ncbi:MAG: DUF1223 domain-containing protein [Phyllobacteriaceae bacterium]|nr:DUF1223 domain-containing protein [Phyllobacteriaceae bacterium]
MVRHIFTGLAMAFALATPASAQDVPAHGVVELFTSQGCSSCPPADANLAKLAQDKNLVTLAYHVDYWDYLGWRDTLASPANTERQHGYARMFDARSVYTPQAVLNGRTHVNGADGPAVSAALETSKLGVAVRLTRIDDRVVAETGTGPAPTGEAVIVFVWYKGDAAVKVERGENKGDTIRYVNSVLSVSTTGMYHGEAGRFEMPVSEAAKSGADGCAVLVQEIGPGGAPGAILGAAAIRL